MFEPFKIYSLHEIGRRLSETLTVAILNQITRFRSFSYRCSIVLFTIIQHRYADQINLNIHLRAITRQIGRKSAKTGSRGFTL